MNSIRYVFFLSLIAGTLKASCNQKSFYFGPTFNQYLSHRTRITEPLRENYNVTPYGTQSDVSSVNFLLATHVDLSANTSSTINLPLAASPESIAQAMKLIEFAKLEQLPADHGLSKEELTIVLMVKAQQMLKKLKEK